MTQDELDYLGEELESCDTLEDFLDLILQEADQEEEERAEMEELSKLGETN